MNWKGLGVTIGTIALAAQIACATTPRKERKPKIIATFVRGGNTGLDERDCEEGDYAGKVKKDRRPGTPCSRYMDLNCNGKRDWREPTMVIRYLDQYGWERKYYGCDFERDVVRASR